MGGRAGGGSRGGGGTYSRLTSAQQSAVDMMGRHINHLQGAGAQGFSHSQDQLAKFVKKNWDKAQAIVKQPKNSWMSPQTPFSHSLVFVDYKTLKWNGEPK